MTDCYADAICKYRSLLYKSSWIQPKYQSQLSFADVYPQTKYCLPPYPARRYNWFVQISILHKRKSAIYYTSGCCPSDFSPICICISLFPSSVPIWNIKKDLVTKHVLAEIINYKFSHATNARFGQINPQTFWVTFSSVISMSKAVHDRCNISARNYSNKLSCIRVKSLSKFSLIRLEEQGGYMNPFNFSAWKHSAAFTQFFIDRLPGLGATNAILG